MFDNLLKISRYSNCKLVVIYLRKGIIKTRGIGVSIFLLEIKHDIQVSPVILLVIISKCVFKE